MALKKWNEQGRIWEDDHGLLDEEQKAQCARADVADALHTPIPTRMVSNGEYMPVPQTDKQRQVETRLLEFGALAADSMSKLKETYLALAIEPDHVRYGWIRARA